MIYAGILAAGMGLRMNRQDLPKPFLPLGKKPIILHTLEQFFGNARIEKVIVVAPEAWKLYAEDLIASFNTMGKETFVISGGANKTESVSAVAEYISQSWGIADSDILVAHDAIRPFITQRIIDENIDTAMQYGAASTVISTNDTILASQDEKMISAIPPKALMFAQQTPQSYRLNLLENIFTRSRQDGIFLSGESELARLFLKYGRQVHLVQGEYSNMKIINSYDLAVANALLQEMNYD
jgi:2-C-methyl-D-erythritol 4-phosphate cytidylyltransferase